MAILLKYVLFIIKRTVGEAKKKWKDLLAKAWIEDAKAQKTTFHKRGPLAVDLIIIKAIYYTFLDVYDRVSTSSASWWEKRTQLKTTLFPGLLSPRDEVEFLIRLVPVPVFAPVLSKRTATIPSDILRAERKRPPSDQLKTPTPQNCYLITINGQSSKI